MNNWSALGENPVPGDVGAVQRVGTRLGTVADEAELLVGTLRRVDAGTGTAVWRGPASETFRQLLATVGPQLTALASSYQSAHSATTTYAAALSAAQDKARQAESDGKRAQNDRATAERHRAQAAADAGSAAGTVRAAQLRLLEADVLLLSPPALLDPSYNAALRQWQQQIRDQKAHAETRQAEAKGREKAYLDARNDADFRLALARGLGATAKDELGNAARVYADSLAAAGDASGSPRRGLLRPPIVFHGPAPVSMTDWKGLTKSPGKKWKKGDVGESPEFQSLLSASTTVGGAAYNMAGSVKGRYGEGQAYLQGFGAEASGHGSVGMFDDGTYGAEAGASAAVYAVRAGASGKLGAGPASVEGKVNAQVGGRANIGGQVGFGKGTAKAQAGADVFAGAEAHGELTGDVGGIRPTVGATVQAGVGATAKVNATYNNGKLHISTEFGASIGLGGKVDGSVDIDVKELSGNIGKGVSGAAKTIGSWF